MNDTKTVLAMLAKAREDILKEKSSKSKTGDAFVVFMKKKGERCAKEVFAYNWNGNRDEYDDALARGRHFFGFFQNVAEFSDGKW